MFTGINSGYVQAYATPPLPWAWGTARWCEKSVASHCLTAGENHPAHTWTAAQPVEELEYLTRGRIKSQIIECQEGTLVMQSACPQGKLNAENVCLLCPNLCFQFHYDESLAQISTSFLYVINFIAHYLKFWHKFSLKLCNLVEM